MKILDFKNFMNEVLDKNKDQYNTSVMFNIGFKLDPFNKNGVMLKPEGKKNILDKVEKTVVDIVTNAMKASDAFKNSQVISKNDEQSTILLKSDFNLAQNDDKCEIAGKIIDEINKAAEKENDLSGISTAIASFLMNDQKQEVAVAYNPDKKDWEELDGFESKDRSMKF